MSFVENQTKETASIEEILRSQLPKSHGDCTYSPLIIERGVY